jgi:hypothetical protein
MFAEVRNRVVNYVLEHKIHGESGLTAVGCPHLFLAEISLSQPPVTDARTFLALAKSN